MNKGIVTEMFVILEISATLSKFHMDFSLKYRISAMLSSSCLCLGMINSI